MGKVSRSVVWMECIVTARGLSRFAAVNDFEEMGVQVTLQDSVPFTITIPQATEAAAAELHQPLRFCHPPWVVCTAKVRVGQLQHCHTKGLRQAGLRSHTRM